jgi:hypothetical protein
MDKEVLYNLDLKDYNFDLETYKKSLVMGENGNIIKLTKTHTNKYKGLVFNPDYPE